MRSYAFGRREGIHADVVYRFFLADSVETHNCIHFDFLRWCLGIKSPLDLISCHKTTNAASLTAFASNVAVALHPSLRL
jgi:hypothetical protein